MVINVQSTPVIAEIPTMHANSWQKKAISNLGDAEMSVPYLIVMLEYRCCIFSLFTFFS